MQKHFANDKMLFDRMVLYYHHCQTWKYSGTKPALPSGSPDPDFMSKIPHTLNLN
jgi:hypothetical protein